MLNQILLAYPLIMIAAQLLPGAYALAAGIIFTLAGLTKPLRGLLLFGLTILGHLFWWSFFQQLISLQLLSADMFPAPILTILGRLGLMGYLILFVAWERFQPCRNRYIKFGNMRTQLKFPLIWQGFHEYIWRFLLVFCLFCSVAAAFFCFKNNNITLLPYGLLFAAVNSVLEEILWRGFILGRMADFLGEKKALIITSLTFGFYHLSLGFSPWICLFFAIGGFYMGGCAVKSKGIGASIVMHFFVNMVFVLCGVIF